MTKLEICAIEDANPGQVYLYPEGIFYKAYQKSAWILCTKLHPFKLSSRSLKGLERPLLSVGFPQSSLDKFSAGLMLLNLAFVNFTWHPNRPSRALQGTFRFQVEPNWAHLDLFRELTTYSTHDELISLLLLKI